MIAPVRTVAALSLACSVAAAHPAEALAPVLQSDASHKRPERKKRRKPRVHWHRPWHRREKDGPSYTVDSTAYHADCGSGGGTTTAMGTTVHVGEVANNSLPLGTWVRTSRRVFGRRRFRVEDRIGSGSQLDIYAPSCDAALAYGRETITITVER